MILHEEYIEQSVYYKVNDKIIVFTINDHMLDGRVVCDFTLHNIDYVVGRLNSPHLAPTNIFACNTDAMHEIISSLPKWQKLETN